MNSISMLLVVASAMTLTWPLGNAAPNAKVMLSEIRVATDEVTPVPALPPVPTIAMPEPSAPPDPAANSRYKYWDYLNIDALIARARAMIADNESVIGKLSDLKSGSVSGLTMTDEQKWTRMAELNGLYWKMMLSSFTTLDDINHADVYFSQEVVPPFQCPPANGVYER